MERWELPSLSVIERTQLTPELGPQLAAARRMLFVDAEAEAAAGPGGWRLELRLRIPAKLRISNDEVVQVLQKHRAAFRLSLHAS